MPGGHKQRADKVHKIDDSESGEPWWQARCGKAVTATNGLRGDELWENVTCGMCRYLGRNELKTEE